MRTRRSILRTALVALVISTPALADAPTDQYAPYNRNATVIQDSKTLLGWQRTDGRIKKDATARDLQCASFGRLPTIKELLTLLDEEPHQEYESTKVVNKYIDRDAFGTATAPDGPYWSSTPASSTTTVWGLNFGTAKMEEIDVTTGTAFVRCVQ